MKTFVSILVCLIIFEVGVQIGMHKANKVNKKDIIKLENDISFLEIRKDATGRCLKVIENSLVAFNRYVGRESGETEDEKLEHMC